MITLVGIDNTEYVDTDREEYENHSSKGEICDEDEFVPFSEEENKNQT